MTTRKTLFLDRLAVLLVGLLLIAAGAGAAYWWSGRSGLPGTLSTGPATDVVDSAWFPWASGAAGVVLVLLGLRWIAAHLGRRTVSHLHVRGSGARGRLDAAAGQVVGTAAKAYADTVGVRSASGSVVRDRGQLVATIDATVERSADLRTLAERADRVSAELAQVLERDDVRCRVQLRVATFSRSLPRAR